MSRKLTDFIGIHAGETAWIFGKGPSLDTFDMQKAGPLRCAINDVVKEVPGCLYGFANDAVNEWAHVYKAGQVLFTPERTLGNGFLRPVIPDNCEVVAYPDTHDDERLTWTPERLAVDGLSIRRGTLGSAIQILYVMGVRSIVCVGIDGGGQHAARQWHTRLRADHALDYTAIREAFITAARIMGIAVRFWGKTATTDERGLMQIKITDHCFIKGVPYRTGEIIDVLPSDAATVIGCGRAVAWKAPEAPEPAQIESATAQPASEPEKAVAKAINKPRRKASAVATA